MGALTRFLRFAAITFRQGSIAAGPQPPISMDASHADSGCAPPTTQCLLAADVQNGAADFNNSTTRRPHRISSASSTLSDLGSDVFSSYDSRRSTLSSVTFPDDAAAACPTASSPPSASPPATSLTRSRENAKLLQAARIQRRRAESTNSAATNATSTTADDDASARSKSDHNLDINPRLLRRRKRASTKHYKPANPKAALAATEPPHENLLTKMAFAEQQQWINVQEKTFTKWLNTKIEARDLEVVDLIKDLSDGVSPLSPPLKTNISSMASYN